MAGHNHYYLCDCNWCTSQHGVAYGMPTVKKYSHKTRRTSKPLSATSYLRNLAKQYNSVISYWTKCWYCKNDVFIYANSYGSVVLFDTASPNWDKHYCSKVDDIQNQRAQNTNNYNRFLNFGELSQNEERILSDSAQISKNKIPPMHKLTDDKQRKYIDSKVLVKKRGKFTDIFHKSYLVKIGYMFEDDNCKYYVVIRYCNRLVEVLKVESESQADGLYKTLKTFLVGGDNHKKYTSEFEEVKRFINQTPDYLEAYERTKSFCHLNMYGRELTG